MIERIYDNLFIRTSHIQQMQSVIWIQSGGIYLFDPCYFDDEIREIHAFAGEHEQGREQYVVLTHSDFDHVAGVPYFPSYRVVTASTWDEENEKRSTQQIELFDSQFYVDRPWEGKMPQVSIHRQFHHGEAWEDFTFLHAKGHTRDGLVAISADIAVVGDYLSALEFPFIYTSYLDYCATMAEMRKVFDERSVNLVITQHGPYAKGQDEVKRRFDIAEDYLNQLGTVVDEAVHEGRDIEEVIERSRGTFTFDGRPISPGIARYHENNIKLAVKEGIPTSQDLR